jgi:hypothetical protein
MTAAKPRAIWSRAVRAFGRRALAFEGLPE